MRKDIKTERQIDRETERQRGRETERQGVSISRNIFNREIEYILRDICTDRQWYKRERQKKLNEGQIRKYGDPPTSEI